MNRPLRTRRAGIRPIRATGPRAASWAVAVACLALASATHGDDLADLGAAPDATLDEFVKELDDKAEPPDLDLLRTSYLSALPRWHGVQPTARPRKPADPPPPGPFGWKPAENGSIAPIGPQPATLPVAVPEAGTYRIWLRYVGSPDRPQPATLTLSGATDAAHVFGAKPVPRTGGAAGNASPFHFEAEYQRLSAPTKPLAVWEFWDVPLAAGRTVFALSSSAATLRADHLLVTRSMSFRPSLLADPKEATLNRTFYRFRVLPGAAGKPEYGLGGRLTYHWRRPDPQTGEPIWAYDFFPRDAVTSESGGPTIRVGEWSRFIDVTDGISSPGPWATASLGFTGVTSGSFEAQLAWYPHPGAVLATVRSAVAGGSGVLLVPLDAKGFSTATAAADDPQGAWGMRPAGHLKLLETPEDVAARHRAHAEAAVAALPRQGNPRPSRIRLRTGNGAAAGVRAETTALLAAIGINTVSGADAPLRDRLGLRGDESIALADALYFADTHDPTDPLVDATIRRVLEATAAARDRREPGSRDRITTIKLGDEIGNVIGPRRLNALPDARRMFHDYLRGELAAAGRDASFFGVADVAELDLLGGLPPDASRFERRLHYHSARFMPIFTARFYRRLTAAAADVLPGARTYCNFSPHPPMFGQDMNGSDWFALSREGGTSLAWAEDWAGLGGSWAFAGVQTVGYYAALVDCAARKHGQPAGFYVVVPMGGADRRMFACVARGIFDLEMYAFGPRYAGAEFSNFWDGSPEAYASIARGAFALGPADELIAEGVREPRRVALLYNRSHEIWNGGAGGFQTDRLLTFIALQHAHLPVDVVLEEDLEPESLARYGVVYVQGHNLADRHVAALARWVEEGGTLVGVAGCGSRDEYDDPADAAADLFGARPRVVGESTGSWHPLQIPAHAPVDRIRVADSPLTRALEADVVGVKAVLEPTTGTPVATYADGSVAAVAREVGRGRTLLWGIQPGTIYKGDAAGSNRFRLDRLSLVAAPALAALGPPSVVVDDPQVEVCRFDHPAGIAITLTEVAITREPTAGSQPAAAEPAEAPTITAEPTGARAAAELAEQKTLTTDTLDDVAPAGGPAPTKRSITVSVRTERPIAQATTSFQGPVAWRREGDRIVVDLPLPASVDVLVLREAAPP